MDHSAEHLGQGVASAVWCSSQDVEMVRDQVSLRMLQRVCVMAQKTL